MLEIEAEDDLTLMIFLVWEVVSARCEMNLLYKEIFTSKEAIAAVAGLTTLHVHHDIFEILKAESPPTIEWFKSIPEIRPSLLPDDRWGVYFLLFEKDGEKPILYVGSRTSFEGGIRIRVSRYFTLNSNSMPSLVEEAIKNGFSITHHGILITCDTPQPQYVVPIRLLVVALEAVLTWILWTLPRPDKRYGFPDFFTWDRTTLPWGGASSHNPLKEQIRGDIDLVLTQEQLDNIAKQRKERRVAAQKEADRVEMEKRAEQKARYNEEKTRIAEERAAAVAKERALAAEEKSARAAEKLHSAEERKKKRALYNKERYDRLVREKKLLAAGETARVAEERSARAAEMEARRAEADARRAEEKAARVVPEEVRLVQERKAKNARYRMERYHRLAREKELLAAGETARVAEERSARAAQTKARRAEMCVLNGEERRIRASVLNLHFAEEILYFDGKEKRSRPTTTEEEENAKRARIESARVAEETSRHVVELAEEKPDELWGTFSYFV